MAVRRYYPGVTVAIGLRFDDALHYIRQANKTPTTEIARRRAPEQASIADAEALIASIPGTEPLFLSTPSDSLSWLVNVVPRSASITKPGFRDTGTFDIEVGYHELPIDPVLVKALQVRVFAGCVSPEAFAQGMTEAIPVGSRRVRRSVVQGLNEAGLSDESLLAIWGVGDGWEVEIGENPVARLEGRDLRSIFLSSPMRRGVLADLDLTKPLDEVLRDLIAAHPLGGQMGIAVRPTDWPGGVVPSPGAEKNVTKVWLGASGQKKSGPPPRLQESKLNWWQAICAYAFLVGAVPYFRGTTLVVRPATSLYDLRDPSMTFPGARSPFAGELARRRPDGQPTNVRQLVYGYNVSRIKYKRSFQGPDRPRVVEVARAVGDADLARRRRRHERQGLRHAPLRQDARMHHQDAVVEQRRVVALGDEGNLVAQVGQPVVDGRGREHQHTGLDAFADDAAHQPVVARLVALFGRLLVAEIVRLVDHN